VIEHQIVLTISFCTCSSLSFADDPHQHPLW
jgi:hypothetical protein